MNRPLISCVMPTSGRPQFARQALGAFMAQTYGPKELSILDNAADPSFGDPPLFDGVFYSAAPDPPSLGTKRNAINALAHGEIICHWDDDDLYHPLRLEDQVRRLLAGPEEVTGYGDMLFLNPDGATWKYHSTTPGYAIGSSLMYWKRVWQRTPFPDHQITNGERVPIALGTDTHWMRAVKAGAADAGWFLIARNHGGNLNDRRPEKISQDSISWKKCEPLLSAIG